MTPGDGGALLSSDSESFSGSERALAPGMEWSQGWSVVVAAAIGVGVGLSSLITYSFGILVKPITATLGWTRAEANGMHFFIALATTIAAPLVGILVDRFGPRRVALVGIPVAALGYASLSRIGPDLALFYTLAFIVGFLAVATGPIVWTRAVNGWFHAHRGLALAATLAGTGIFALLGPPAITEVSDQLGWRSAFLALGGLMSLSWFSTLVWFKDRGRTRVTSRVPKETKRAGPALTLAQALRSKRFWAIAGGLFLASIGVTAMIAHLVPMLTDRGITPAAAAWVASTLGLSVLGGRLLTGWSLDHFATGWVCAAIMIGAAGGCLLMLQFDGRHLLVPVITVILVGLAAGGEVDLVAYLAAKFFGLSSYGKVYGVLYACFAIGAGISPVLAGYLFDESGNYRRALPLLAVAFAGSALLLGSLGRQPGLDASASVSH